jgi:hypothetical protein
LNSSPVFILITIESGRGNSPLPDTGSGNVLPPTIPSTQGHGCMEFLEAAVPASKTRFGLHCQTLYQPATSANDYFRSLDIRRRNKGIPLKFFQKTYARLNEHLQFLWSERHDVLKWWAQ